MSAFAYRVTNGKVAEVDHDKALAGRTGFTWIHLESGSEEAQAWLRARAKLPVIIVETLTATETRPRCDLFEQGALLNLRGLSSAEMTTTDPLASIRLWGEKGRVISVTRRPLTALTEVRRDMADGKILDPGDLIAAIASEITAELDPEVAELGDSLDDCECDINSDNVFEVRKQVARVRARSIGYRRFLTPQRTALEKLAAVQASWLQDEDRIHLAAAADRAARMAEELESIRERASLTHDTLTDLRAEQIDSRALIISVIAMVFLPLTFVTGLYGMNVKGIWFADQPWAFDAIATFCIVVAGGVGAWFVRKHWF